MSPHRTFFVASLTFLVSCHATSASQAGSAASTAKPAGAPIHLTLIGTNDLHGWVFPQKVKVPGDGELEEGGVATFAAYLALVRAHNPGGTLLLDAGDLFQGTLASNLTEGEVVIDAYNALGYQAAAVGNHEFDYGPVGPEAVAPPGGDPFGALKQRLKQAKFPLLAVNIYDAKTNERPAWLGNDGTVILEVKGVKVGILGLITPSTPFTTNPVNVATLRFGSLAPEALAAANKLRQRGAQVVIAVAHAGGRCANASNPRSLEGCDVKNGEIFEMLDQLPEHTLDAVIAGHTHAVMGHFVKGTPVIETPGQGRSFGLIELYLDPRSHRVIEDQTTVQPVIPICEKVDKVTRTCDPRQIKELKAENIVPATFLGKPVVKDAALARLLEPALQRVEADQHRKLGIKLPSPLVRNYGDESALGDVLADSLREMEKADVALLNPGGLRADLPAGDLTYGSLYEVLPFDNTLATVTLNGEELKRMLQAAYGSRKGVFQESGLKVQLAKCPGQGRLKNVTTLDGKPLSAEKTYRLAMPDFLARGGDGLGPVMSTLPKGHVDLGLSRPLNFRELLLAHLQKTSQTLVAPKPGRISYLDEGQPCGAVADPH